MEESGLETLQTAPSKIWDGPWGDERPPRLYLNSLVGWRQMTSWAWRVDWVTQKMEESGLETLQTAPSKIWDGLW